MVAATTSPAISCMPDCTVGKNLNVIVFGGTGGIGSALIRLVVETYPDAAVFATWHSSPPADELGATWAQVDLRVEESIRSYASQFDEVFWIINAAGVLHEPAQIPEKSLQQVDPEFFMRNVQLNALSTLLIAKHFTRQFKRAFGSASAIGELSAQFATVSAKVGSIEDNRLGGWYSYRCSKAALNMAIKNISIEWSRTLPSVCVSALHPGTTDTDLSAPFQRNVPDGKLFPPQKTAEYLVDLVSRLTPDDTGKFFAYDGQVLPW